MILAARGVRNMNQGEEKIENPFLVARHQWIAERVYADSVVAAIILTILLLLI